MSAVRIVREERGIQNIRYGVALDDGAQVESVLYRGDTLCLSTQVGCGVGCPFCASGRDGFGRQLSKAELWGQVEAVRAAGHAPTKLTLSGVGEPLHNARATLPFLVEAHAAGLRTSVTTSGGPLNRLPDLLSSLHNGVTISVHAGREETRAAAVPGGPALEPLFETLAEVLPTLTRKRRKKVALAYLLLRGKNDEVEELDAFAARAARLGIAVHLYAHNPVENAPELRADRDAYEAAYARLRATGLVVRMSSKARQETTGGCGTLLALGPRKRAR